MILEELEQKLSKDGTTTQGWGTRIWILDTDVAKMVKVLRVAKRLVMNMHPHHSVLCGGCLSCDLTKAIAELECSHEP